MSQILHLINKFLTGSGTSPIRVATVTVQNN